MAYSIDRGPSYPPGPRGGSGSFSTRLPVAQLGHSTWPGRLGMAHLLQTGRPQEWQEVDVGLSHTTQVLRTLVVPDSVS